VEAAAENGTSRKLTAVCGAAGWASSTGWMAREQPGCLALVPRTRSRSVAVGVVVAGPIRPAVLEDERYKPMRRLNPRAIAGLLAGCAALAILALPNGIGGRRL